MNWARSRVQQPERPRGLHHPPLGYSMELGSAITVLSTPSRRPRLSASPAARSELRCVTAFNRKALGWIILGWVLAVPIAGRSSSTRLISSATISIFSRSQLLNETQLDCQNTGFCPSDHVYPIKPYTGSCHPYSLHSCS